jgi:hypothetical protein
MVKETFMPVSFSKRLAFSAITSYIQPSEAMTWIFRCGRLAGASAFQAPQPARRTAASAAARTTRRL